MSAVVFESVDEAFAAHTLPVLLYVRVGGVAIDATEARVSHSVNRPVGTCTVYCEAPRPASLELNADLEIEMGYPGASRRVFQGFVVNDETVTDQQGKLTRIDGVGWASRLASWQPGEIEITGPVSLKDAFRSLCELRDIPTYLSDDTTATDGLTEIVLGGNEDINGGHIRFDSQTSPLDWITRNAELFGYRVFDSPDGTVRMARVSGLASPNEDETPPIYEEGVNCFRLSRARDLRPMANYIEVIGARFTEDDGGPAEIRAIPLEVPYDARLAPLGVNKYTVSSQDITTSEQAEWVRNATEVDRAAPYELMTWDTWGRADLQPGNVITLDAPDTHGIVSESYWLMDIDQSINDQGYLATLTAWRGAGEALPAGNDCITYPVPGDSVIHAGTQTISYYRDPSKDSVRDPYDPDSEVKDRRWVVVVDITISDDDYSSLRLNGIAHGTNSIGNKTTITGSAVEIWQLEDPALPEGAENEFRRVGSVDLPTLNEESSKRRNYASSNRFWTAFSLPLPGTLKVGAAKLIIVSGESDDGEVDDFELAELNLVMCGVGQPVFASAEEPS